MSKKTKKIGFALLVVVILLVIFISNGGEEYTEYPVSASSSFQDTFLVSGNVEASSDVTLSFERIGTISKIYKEEGDLIKKGEVLVSLVDDALLLDREEQEAGLLREKILLTDLIDGPTQEEIAVSLANLNVAIHATNSAYTEAGLYIYETTNKVEKEIRESADTFFSNIDTDSTSLNFSLNEVSKQRLERGRTTLESIFNLWESREISFTDQQEILRAIEQTLFNLTTIDVFLNILAKEFDDTDNVQLASEIRTVRNIVIEYQGELSNKINFLIGKETEQNYISQQHNQLISGSKDADILAQQATVTRQEQVLNKILLKLEQSFIEAPFDGVVGEIFVEEQETVGVNDPVLRIISNEELKIKVQVSELDIDYISVDEEADFTVDAFDGTFSAVVTNITPTENYIGSAPVYSVELDILEKDSRLRSGMSVSVSIVRDDYTNFIKIDNDALSFEDGVPSVRIKNSDNKEELLPVRTGTSFSDGTIEITDGLNGGEILLIKNNKE